MKEEAKLKAELAETKAKLKDCQDRLNHLTSEMKARLDQISVGQRSAFEDRLLKWLRSRWSKDTPRWAFVHEANPVLNVERAEVVIEFFDMLHARGTAGGIALEHYNKFRGALEVMLDVMPSLPERLDQIKL